MPEPYEVALLWWGIIIGIALCGGVIGTVLYAVRDRQQRKEAGRTHRRTWETGRK